MLRDKIGFFLTFKGGWLNLIKDIIRTVCVLAGLFCFIPTQAWAAWDRTATTVDTSLISGNYHYNSGGRRMVRINNTIIEICSQGSSDYTYRSTNNGNTWTRIDTDGSFSGCLIAGTDSMVYHFYRYNTGVRLVKFKYNETPPAPVTIYSSSSLGTGSHGAYNMLNAIVDQNGNLYVSVHGDGSASGYNDHLFLLTSDKTGAAWNVSTIRSGSSSHSWGFVHLEVSTDNTLYAVYSEWGSYSIQLSTSTNGGSSWSHQEIASGKIYNPSILTVGDDTVYVFAQSSLSSQLRGLVFRRSTNSGSSWGGWTQIDGTSISGYADPSPGLGSNGTIYIAYRSGARPDLSGVGGGAGLRERLAMSTNSGTSWTFPDNYFYDANGNPTERVGTRSQVRYQTWWNYGGPLEWTWMQEVNTQLETFYDVNTDVQIRAAFGEGVAPAPIITTASLPNGTIEIAYSQTLQVTGGILPLTWSIASGSLPSGLSLNSNTGYVTGTPTSSGTWSFTARVTDNASRTDDQNLSIRVDGGVLTITTTRLPNGTVGTAYLQTFTASGGTTPYTWSISSGSLPAGLSLNSGAGVISGTPTSSGTSNFTVSVTDANLLTDDQSISIVIEEFPSGPPVIYRSVGPNNTSNLNIQARTVQIAGTTATFSGNMPDNVGVGDVLQYQVNSNYYVAFIYARTSSTQYTVVSVDNTTPQATFSGTTVNVYRAYLSLANAENGIENTAINSNVRNFDTWSGGKNLVTADQVWNIACYKDAVDPAAVDFSGWTTDVSHYLKIFTPVKESEVGASQRHTGTAGTGYTLDPASGVGSPASVVWVNIPDLKIQGLEINASAMYGISCKSSTPRRVDISYNLLYNATGRGIYMYDYAYTARIYNNIVYNCTEYGIMLVRSRALCNVYNNTIYGCVTGIYQHQAPNTSSCLINNICYNNAMDFSGYSGGITLYPDNAVAYNLSMDATADDNGGEGNIVSATVIFMDEAGHNFLLSSSDIAARNAGTDLSAQGFSDDILGQVRALPWDIGADEGLTEGREVFPTNTVMLPTHLKFSVEVISSGIGFVVSLEKQSDYSVSIYDMQGREIWALAKKNAAPGYYHLNLNSHTSINLCSGKYIVLFKRGNESLVKKKISVIR